VSVYNIEDGDESGSFIVTDFIDGPSLKKWLAHRDVSPRQAAELIVKVARALEHAHGFGIVHRDIKPANILMDGQDEPHLADFGLAKRDAAEDSLAIDGKLVGTPTYMAPEQARADHSAIDRRTDIYSLGVILYELLTGEPPFRGELSWLVDQIANAAPKPLRSAKPAIPDDLEKICLKCLAKDKAARYQTAKELADDLQRYLNGESLRGVPVPLPRRMKKWVWRHRRWVSSLAATALCCLGIAGAVWWWTQAPVERRTVLFNTEPQGCEITVVKLDETTGDPDPNRIEKGRGVTPLTMKLEPGDYLVVPVLNRGERNERFHEVLRHVPSESETRSLTYRHLYWELQDDGSLKLPQIRLPRPDVAQSMGFVEKAGAWRSFLVTKRHPVVWDMPALYVDLEDQSAKSESMLPGSFAAALNRAEELGKRLPTRLELEYVSEVVCRVRNAKENSGKQDRLTDGSEIRGLFSDFWEWTSTITISPESTPTPGGFPSLPAHSLLGGAAPLATSSDESNVIFPERIGGGMESSADFGMRCVRSSHPRTKPTDFPRLQP
jgi:hypothetical protein